MSDAELDAKVFGLAAFGAPQVDAAGLIAAAVTGWFWLAFLSSLGIIAGGIALLLRRGPRKTSE